jgi:hypothetical protein
MGYYTNYTLEVIETKDNEDSIWEHIEDNEDLSYAVGEYSQECKWYDNEKDMRAFSKIYPNTLFKLKGEGEEAGDVWIKYFKDGKMQSCPAKITFDDYDENKLK